MNIGGAIADIRKTKKISQGDLSHMAKINQSYLSQIENNKKIPNIKTIEEIAKAMNIPLSMIFLFSITESEVPKNKKDIFNAIMPIMKSFFNEFLGPIKIKRTLTRKLVDKLIAYYEKAIVDVTALTDINDIGRYLLSHSLAHGICLCAKLVFKADIRNDVFVIKHISGEHKDYWCTPPCFNKATVLHSFKKRVEILKTFEN